MLRSLTLAAFLLFALFWSMIAVAATGRPLALPQSTDTGASTAVTPTAFITVTTVEDEVNNDGDCSLREALQAATMDTAIDGCAAGSGADTIYVPGRSYKLEEGQLVLSRTVTLQGSITSTTILDGNHHDRVLYIEAGATVTLRHLDIRNGRPPGELNDSGYFQGQGGGIANYGTTLIAYSIIHDNEASLGGSFPYYGGGADGGGIANGGILTVTNSTISGNAAGNSLINSHAGSVDCGPIGNGGGIANGGTLVLENATIAGNRPGTLGECTLPSPASTGKGGGVYSGNEASPVAFMTLRNSIISGNQNSDCSGKLTSLGHNIIDVMDGCTIHQEASDLYWNARLAPAQDNGGPTLTNALTKNSPAIDAGNCVDSAGITVTVDQRGKPRPQGDGCDIGAFESPYTSTFQLSSVALPFLAVPPCVDPTTICNLSRNALADDHPVWSPDGKKIAFVRSAAGSVGNELKNIYVTNLDGTQQVNVTNDAYRAFENSGPIWSPDGNKIAFSAVPVQSDNLEIIVMDADGSHQTNITNTPHQAETNLSWSPDSKTILYVSSEIDPCCNHDLKLIHADGSNPQLLFAYALPTPYPWFPNGTRILIDSTSFKDYESVDISGTNPLTINYPSSLTYQPVLSPSGQKTAFVCAAQNDILEFQYDICTLNLNGSQLTKVTDDLICDNDLPVWSPDGSKLLFIGANLAANAHCSSMSGDELRIFSSDGSHILYLDLVTTPVPVIAGSVVWSPDGRKIAFVSDESGDHEIYVVKVSE